MLLPRTHPNHNVLGKLGNVYVRILRAFAGVYYPHQFLSLGEGIVPWRGNLAFRVYNPDKPVKYGIKAYMVCDSGNGYCSKIRLYTGRSNQPVSDKGKTYDLVMDMMSGYFGRNHILFCANYYSSPWLFIDLWQLGVGATGTVRQNRKGVPQVIKGRKLSRKGETVVYKSRQLTITKYLDAKPDFVMSIFCPSNNIPTDRTDPRTHMPVTRPHVVVMYNKMMGGVDRSDQMLAYSRIPVNTMKWWKKGFFSYSQHECVKRLHNL